MRKINFLFVLVLFTLVLLSVASLAFAQTTNKTLELSEFQSIYVNSNYTVYLRQTNKQEVKVEEQDFVFVKDNGVLKRITIDDILFLEAMGDYVKVHTPQKFHVVHATLKSIEEKLPSSKFLRVHRSYIVAINKIDFIQEGTISIGKTTIPVADTHKSSLNRRLNLL